MTDNMFRWDRTDDGIVTLTMDDPNAPVNTMNQTFQDDVRATVEKLERELADGGEGGNCSLHKVVRVR